MNDAQRLFDKIEDRIDDCDNPLAGLKLYDLQKRLQEQMDNVSSLEKAVKEYQMAKGKVEDPDIISAQLDDYQDRLETEREDLSEMVDFISQVLSVHDDGDELIPFINQYQRTKARELAESGELGMGHDPTEEDNE